jgi:hypothetical protein
MSDFILEILEPTTNILEVETSFGSIVNNIEIELFDTFNLEIVNTEKVLASDLPDNIPMSKIIGNLDVARISGLDDYLDNYEFDCGTP